MRLLVLLVCLLYPASVSSQANIEAVRNESKGGFTGNVGSSVNHQNGNVNTSQYSLSTLLDYRVKDKHTFLSGSYSFGEADKVSFKNEAFGHLRWSQMFGLLGYELFTQGEFNEFRSLKIRQLNGFYFRLSADRQDLGTVSLGVGFMSDYELLTEGVSEGLVARGTSYLNYVYRLGTATFKVIGYYQPKLTDFSDFRLLGVSEATLVANGKIELSQKYTLTYDARPPTDVSSLDKTTITTIKLKF